MLRTTLLVCLLATPVYGQSRVAYAARTLDGAEVRIGAGEPATVVAVFATWCTTCRGEFAILDSLHSALARRGVRVLALSVDEADDAHVRRFTQARRTRVLVAHDGSGAVGRTLGTVGVPETYLVDRTGIIRWHGRGDLRAGLAALRQALGTLEQPR